MIIGVIGLTGIILEIFAGPLAGCRNALPFDL